MPSVERRLPTDTEFLQDWTPEARVLAELLVRRQSCRAFRPEPVPRQVIERMLQIAQMTPSWCNTQPWQLVVTEGGATERFRERLFAKAVADAQTPGGQEMLPDLPFPEAYSGVYKERQREVGWQLYESLGIAYGDRAASGKQVLENFRLFGAPHMLIVTSNRQLGVYGAIDTGLYLGTLVLAAESLGLGIVVQAALAGYPDLAREMFNIPDDRIVVAGASFGYSNDTHPANAFRSRRAALDDAVQWVND